jgi:hypothetical protein
MMPETVLRYNQVRFQQKHLFRDPKQHTGFGDCQSRDVQSLNFHANATLTAVNISRVNAPTHPPFSMAFFIRNRFMAQNIFRYFKIEPNLIENPYILSK